jgi:hypothetical protein
VYASRQPARRTGSAARRVERDVPELAGRVAVAAHDLAVDHHARADAVRHGHVHEVRRRLGAALPEPHAGRARRRSARSRSAPAGGAPRRARRACRRRASRAAARRARARCAGRPCRAPRGRSPRSGRPRRGWPGARRMRSGASASTRATGSVIVSNARGRSACRRSREHQVRAAEAHVDRHHQPVARADVEHLRLAAARRVDRGPLVDGALAQQLVDQRGDHAAPDVHAAREVGARDRLVLADEVEHDLPVDLARGRAGRADEPPGVDLSHDSGGTGASVGGDGQIGDAARSCALPNPTLHWHRSIVFCKNNI